MKTLYSRLALALAPVLLLILTMAGTGAVRAADTLVPRGATWRYLDDGSDQGTAWRAPGFDDTLWKSGPAQLGYGEGDEATVVASGPASAKFITTYFRHAFNVNPAAYTVVRFQVKRDDGVVLYLNGTEFYRNNLGTGTILFDTTASNAGDDGQNFLAAVTLDPALLQNGVNVIAAEIHQDSRTSSDISFDFELVASTENNPPVVSLDNPPSGRVFIAPANVPLRATATDPESNLAGVEFYVGGVLVGNDSASPFETAWNAVPIGAYTLYAVAYDTLGLRATSVVASVSVEASSAPTIAGRVPAPGPVTSLSQLTVTFSEAVSGVRAQDLLLNGRPASSVAGVGSSYRFSFSQPAEGTVHVAWEGRAAILDFEPSPRRFDPLGAGATWQYTLTDGVAPVAAAVQPAPGATVRSLTVVEVTFSEAVTGVDAADLRMNGVPAIAVSGQGAGPYRFEFAAPANGAVAMTWTAGHGIRDLAAAGNAFAGAGWSYTLNNALVFTGEIVINEVMYHPSSERTADEWIELFNRGSNSVNLAGWSLSRGVNFTFPAVTLPAGGYLAVAADVAAFQARYPGVANVTGGWSGQLNNTDEEIELEDANGDRVDAVHYYDEGDFAIRRRASNLAFAWEWFAEHDGLGKSLELRQAALSNASGQNWDSSVAADGTPGRANSVATNNLAPLILDVAHAPAVPRSTNPISVSARIVDETSAGLQVRFWWRPAGTTNPPAFTSVAMLDDGTHGDGAAGDGTFAGAIPAQADRTVVEYYVEAVDGTGRGRTWPAAAVETGGALTQTANALLQVDDAVYEGRQPVYRLILTESDRLAFAAQNRNTEALVNCTLVATEGGAIEVRHGAGIRYRGAGSRGRNPPTYRFDVPSDRRWNGRTALNLNSQYVHSQVIGSQVAIQAGLVTEYVKAVQLRINAVNPANAGLPQFGSYAAVEPTNAELMENHLPDDAGGNVYRASTGAHSATLNYLGTSPTAYINAGYLKNSNGSENDWTDLMALTFALDPTTTPDNEYVGAVRRNLNVDQWLRYFVVCSLMEYTETALGSGRGDDYGLYRGVLDPRFIVLAHDYDTVFGQGDTGGNVNEDIYVATAVGTMNRFLRHPEFEPLFHAEFRRQLATTFSTNSLFSLVDQYLGDWVPAQTIQGIKSFIVARNAAVRAQLPPEPVTVVATIGGEPVSPTYLNTASLSVGGAGITHYRHRVNGGAYGAETPVATPINLGPLADGTYTVSVIGRLADGTWQAESSATLSATWTVLSSLRTVGFNEILARNTSAVNLGGAFPDLVELHNPRATPVDLSGWRLTDQRGEPDKFTFPGGTTLAAGGYLVLVAGNPDGTPSLHLGFNLGQDGETLWLLEPAASGGRVIDTVTFGFQLADRSVGRLAGGRWGLCQPTFGQANVAAATADPSVLRINEWLANGASPFFDDFIELYNPSAQPVELGGLYLTDRVVGRPFQHRITPLSFLEGFAYRAFIADGNTDAGADHVGFQLGSEQGEIGLLSATGAILDSIIYGPQQPGISEGRAPNGGLRITPLSPPTPGGPNPVPPPPVSPQLVTLLPFNDTFLWRYNDTGNDLGTAWTARAYDDSTWPSGPAALGFDTALSNPPEPLRTTLSLTNNRITYYFRARFTAPAGLGASELQATHMTDDGAVFHLNGVEVGRFNMPASPAVITNRTLASSSHEANVFETTTLNLGPLVAGENVIAVEVHQNAGTSTDIVFGLRLDAVVLTNAPSVAGVRIHEVFAASQTVTNSDGTITDWVELQNPSNASVDLAGMSLTDNVAESRRWVFPTGSVIAAGGYMLVRFDDLTAASTNVVAGRPLNSGFALNASGDEVYLFDRPADGGELLDSVAFGVQASDLSISRAVGGTNWVLSLPTPGSATLPSALGNVAGVVINEWMASPSSGDDWFELYNPAPQPVAIGGLRFSDDPNEPGRSPIPALSFLGSGLQGFQRFEADGNPGAGGNHVDFKLSAGGETILLSTTNGTVLTSVTFGPQADGVSEGRLPDGSATLVRFPSTASPGEGNYALLRQVVVNEALSHTDAPLEDAIELFNPTAQGIDLSGWYLSDKRSDLRRYRIPDGTVLGPQGFVVFYESQFNPTFSGQPPYFSLDSTRGDEVYVSEANGAGVLTGYRTSVRFGGAQNGVSFGRQMTSAGADFTAMSRRSFGTDTPSDLSEFRTGRGATNPAPLVGPVVIHEIHYHAPPVAGVENELEEFIELRNVTNALVALYDVAFPTNTWRLRDAVDFEFPTGATLPASGHLVVVGFDPVANPTALAAFRQRYGIGTGVPIYGPWRGRLQNSGDNVELYKPDAPQPAGAADAGYVPYVLADKVRYSDSAPWPTLADGSTNAVGYSLSRRVATAYGNEATNWVAAVPSPGSANGAAVVTPPQIQSISPSQSVVTGATATVVASWLGAGPISAQWSYEGVPIPGATNVVLNIPSVQASNAGLYSVLVSNPAGSAWAATRVDLRSAPVILRQPLNVGAGIGETALLSVVAFGTPPLAYQWQRNGTNVAGGNAALLVIANAQAANDGNYRVILTNAFGSITSAVATLIVRTPPSIVQQPQGADVLVGAAVTLSVQATGAAPLRYQWQKDGANVPNATNAALAFTSARVIDSGSYRVVVSNAVGAVLSDAAVLNVSPPPTLTIATLVSPAEEGTGVPGRFAITRTGSLVAALQVGLGVTGNATAGSDYIALPATVTFPAGTNTLVVSVAPINDGAPEGTESVTVTLQAGAGYGVGTPAFATVQILDDDNRPPVVALTAPADGTVLTAPASVTFTAAASDPDGPVAKVEYFLNGTTKVGEAAVSPYAVTVNALPAGTYQVTAVATDAIGAFTASPAVTLIVNAPPSVSIVTPGNGAIFSPPATVSISVSAADGDGTVSQVELRGDGALLATFTAAPYAFTWSNVAAGEHVLTARAVDNRGAATVSSEVRIQVQEPTPTFADMFAARGVLTAFTNSITGTNTTYTREAGEPRHESRLGAKSAWISWTAPASGPVSMNTLGSSFDTVLSIYTGSVVSNLVRVAGNDDANDLVVQSATTFNAIGGTTYQIAVDGFSATAGGTIQFTLEQANLLPVITTQPAAVTVNQGANAAFSVTAGGPGPLSYRWRFNGTTINNATNASYTRTSAQPSHEGLYSVVITNVNGAITSAPAQLLVRTAPAITAQPQSTGVSPGETATFSVTATGWAPLRYQWRLGGTDLAGQTNATLILSNVQAAQEGSYSVTVANVVGTVTSQAATLQVLDGLVQYEVAELVPMTGTWRYDQAGIDRGTAWRAAAYDDSGWAVGQALFGFEDSIPYPYLFPIGTPLTAPSAGGPITTYFRTRFAFTNGPGTVTLLSENLVDDGAVYFLNGTEVGRLRMGASATNFSSLASTVNPEGQSAFLTLGSAPIVRGENVLAVEVHQSSATSSDVVFGLSLTAIVASTNQPVLLEARRLPAGGGFAVTLGGIAGRTYALESAPGLGATWTQVTTFSNFTGQATYVDPTAPVATRFYRGRLVK